MKDIEKDAKVGGHAGAGHEGAASQGAEDGYTPGSAEGAGQQEHHDGNEHHEQKEQ